MYKENRVSNKHINFGFLIVISAMIVVLAIGTSVSFHGKSDTVMAQSQNETTTNTTMTNGNANTTIGQ